MTTSAPAIDSVARGTSARMRAIFEYLRLIGKSESTVLITGENGTGKEVTATLIHQASHRVITPLDPGRSDEPMRPRSCFGR